MTRLTKSQLEELVNTLATRTAMPMKAGYWNGIVHIYNKDNGELLTSGTTRECYNYIQAFLHALTFAETREI